MVFCGFDFVFFFSSRRRHTRWPRDWSSDVCSSDLDRGLVAQGSEQLDPALAHSQGSRLDPLPRNRLPPDDLCAEELLVGLDRLVQVLDGDAEVMDPLRTHPTDAIRQAFPSGRPGLPRVA